MNTQTKKIESLINRMNNDWLNERIENLDQYFPEKAVLIQPGTHNNITGRETFIDSYREFTDVTEVGDFIVKDFQVDIFGETAVALYTFRIRYTIESTSYDENGLEILVFNRHKDKWQIMWRNQQPDSDA